MPEIGVCDVCGRITVVHGNDGTGFGRKLMLCDDCCPCYNHAPPNGKYYKNRMDGKKGKD